MSSGLSDSAYRCLGGVDVDALAEQTLLLRSPQHRACR